MFCPTIFISIKFWKMQKCTFFIRVEKNFGNKILENAKFILFMRVVGSVEGGGGMIYFVAIPSIKRDYMIWDLYQGFTWYLPTFLCVDFALICL